VVRRIGGRKSHPEFHRVRVIQSLITTRSHGTTADQAATAQLPDCRTSMSPPWGKRGRSAADMHCPLFGRVGMSDSGAGATDRAVCPGVPDEWRTEVAPTQSLSKPASTMPSSSAAVPSTQASTPLGEPGVAPKHPQTGRILRSLLAKLGRPTAAAPSIIASSRFVFDMMW